MPEEPGMFDLVELTRRSFEYAKVGDWDGVLSFYGPDTDWDMRPGGLGKYDGPAALRRFFVDWSGSYKEWDIELEEIRDLGDGIVLAIALTRGRSGRRASWVQLPFAMIATWRDGRVARITSYTDIDEARASAARIAEVSHQLLHAIVDRARRTFEAQACSILIHQPGRRMLVFAAMSGEGSESLDGSESLVGVEIPDSTGVAGRVLATRKPLFLDDVAHDRRFAEDVAEAVGYLPRRLWAIPLLVEDRVLGVLEILDGPELAKSSQTDQISDFAEEAVRALADLGLE
jgi:ketosteroid isomerase-like protein